MKENITKTEQTKEIRKERFEFELTVNGFIICQRYFRINNFNERSVRSLEFAEVVRGCASLIEENLLGKTEIYARHMAPLIFNDESEMRKWFANPANLTDVNFGAHVIIRGEKAHEYVWLGDDNFKDEGVRTEFNEFVDKTADEPVLFKFSVFDNGYDFIKNPIRKPLCETSFDGSSFPKFIRNGVDISNGWTRGKNKYDDMDITKLSHEMSLYYWCNRGLSDLVPVIIRDICEVCSDDDKSAYTVKVKYGDTVYDNLVDYPGSKPEYPYPNGELARLKTKK